MKKLLPLFILLLAFQTFAQKPPSGFTVRYDKFRDRTDVLFADVGFFSPTVMGWFQYKGSKLEEDVQYFNMTFQPTGRCSGFCFKNPTLIFLIDGERIERPRLDNLLSDTATFPLDRETLAKLAAAKKVEYQVGIFEGKISDKTIGKFKTLFDLGTAKK